MDFLLSPLSSSASSLLSPPPSSSPSFSHSSPSSTASANCLSYDAGQPLNCFSFSPSLQQAAIGGKDVRLLSLSASAIAHIAAFPSSAAASHVTSLAFHASSPSLLASLSTCQILLYATSGSQRRLLSAWEEHTRTVNRVLWGGGAAGDDGSAFWSCSQDGQVKRWDARLQGSVAAFIDEIVVRDIAINPFNSLQVAAAYDNGTVCIWDARRASAGSSSSSAASAPSDRLLSIAAHRDLIGTLDWHPSIPHRLASGSQDKSIHVWNTAAAAAAASPLFSITTTSPLGRIAWRPGREHQLASCTTLLDSDVHVWNLQTPFIPLATCRHHRAAVTGLQWREEGDELLSCSKDGTVQQVPLTAAFAPYAHLSTVAVDWSVRGEVASVEDVMLRQSVIAMRNPPPVFPMQFQYAAAAAAKHSSGSGATAAIAQPGLVHIHEVQKEMRGSRRGAGSRQQQDAAEEEEETAEQQRDAGQWKSEVELLVHCARHYRLRDGGVLSCCRHNAQVAIDCGRPQLAHIWDLAALLFADDDTAAGKAGRQLPRTAAVSPMPSPSAAAAPPSFSSPFTFAAAAASSTRDFLAYRVQSPRASASHHLPAYASHVPAASLPAVSQSSSPTAARLYRPMLLPSASHSSPLLSRADMVLQSLPVVHGSHCLRGEGGSAAVSLLQRRRYRSQLLSSLLTQLVDSGDVQTVCCLLTALSPAGAVDGLVPETLRRWYAAYVEQLTRLQLFSSAAETLRACDDVLQLQRSAKSSQQLSLMCARCRRGGEFGERGPYCAHCRQSMTDCALCQLPVRGLFVWCQGCGHGGHEQHMRQWFSELSLCPAGCLHRCVDSLTTCEPE